MNTQNIIFYPGGCYGTFLEWIFTFLENPNSTITSPFLPTGSSHKFKGNFFYPKEKLFEYINSDNKFQFCRIHPDLFEEPDQHERCFSDDYNTHFLKDLDFLKQHFNKILAVAYDKESILWYENNQLDKTLTTEDLFNEEIRPYGYPEELLKDIMTADPILRIKYTLEKDINSKSSSFNVTNLNGWGKNNIHDFEIWELRELLSFYWFTRSNGQLDAWENAKQLTTDALHFVSFKDLRTNFVGTIEKAAVHFGIIIDDEKLSKITEIYQQWLPLQKQINKDELCNKIVNSLVNNEIFDWTDSTLSIIDEAMIQKKLFENHIGIKCDNLNNFPTNTSDFYPLLEKI